MITIVIPTYNEREVIISTIDKIILTLGKTYKYEIIVTDDDSPDKTWELVQKTYKGNSSVKVLRRVKKKKGLAPSVIEAFEKSKGDVLVVTDADAQHDLSKIPALIENSKNADIVIGSRFIPGGSVKGWSKSRIFISKVAALMAKPLLNQNVSDPMSGFFLIKKKLYNKIKKDINPEGYKLLLEFLFVAPYVRLSEVPYRFGLRKKGESKLGGKVIKEYLKMLIRELWSQYGKFIRFCIVGGSGVVVNIGLLYLLTEFGGLYYLFSSALAIETSIITNFILNNYWTWKNKHKGFFNRLVKFNLVSLVALVINIGILFFMTEIMGVWYILSNLIGILISMLINFWFNDKWTFKK